MTELRAPVISASQEQSSCTGVTCWQRMADVMVCSLNDPAEDCLYSAQVVVEALDTPGYNSLIIV